MSFKLDPKMKEICTIDPLIGDKRKKKQSYTEENQENKVNEALKTKESSQ
jgi:hypothetical protein